MSYQRYSWFARAFTPWARAAVLANKIDPAELRERIPAGWSIGGFAKSKSGPYSFSLTGSAGTIHTVIEYGWTGVPAALDRLFAKVAA